MSHYRDLTGMRFGRFTVVEHAGKDSHGYARWKCLCAAAEFKEYWDNKVHV